MNIERESSEDAIRKAFEEYSDQQRSIMIQSAIGTAATSIQAIASAGPIALAITIPVGILTTYWKKKAYRDQAYAYWDSMGIIKKPKRQYRSVMYAYFSDQQGWRYPYGEILADVIVEILAEEYPDLTESELGKIGLDSLKTLHEVRKAFPEVPVEMAAEVILESYGIHKLPTGEYHYQEGEYSPWGHNFPVHTHTTQHHVSPIEPAKFPWIWVLMAGIMFFVLKDCK